MEQVDKKKLGLFTMTMLVVSSSIGSGIFDISYNLADTASPGAALVAWGIVFVGILMLCLSLINLLNKRPDLTGIFAYAEEGFGPLGGFISGWGYWLSAWLGNIAFATVMMIAVATFFPALGDTGTSWPSILIASVVMWLLMLLVNRGVESAAVLNAVITVCKIVPLLLFIVIAFTAFKGGLFTAGFWSNFASNTGSLTAGFDGASVFSQISGSLMVLLWVFVGIEGAAMMSGRAESKAIAGKATIFGLIGLIVIYLLISMLPYGIMSSADIVTLGEPSVAQMFNYLIGPIGAAFVEVAFVISVVGCWLSWTMLPAETTMLMADRNLLPKKFGEVNAQGAPTFSLVFMTILSQIFILTLHFTSSAYQFAFSLCTAAIFISWFFVTVYQIQYTVKHKEEKGYIGNLIIGILGTIFFLFCMIVAGWNYILLCFLLYIIGFFFYASARKAAGKEKVFSPKEWIVVAIISVGGIIGILYYILVTMAAAA